MAAITTLAMTLSTGSKVLLPDDVYGGTYRLFAKVMNRLGVEYLEMRNRGEGRIIRAPECRALSRGTGCSPDRRQRL